MTTTPPPRHAAAVAEYDAAMHARAAIRDLQDVIERANKAIDALKAGQMYQPGLSVADVFNGHAERANGSVGAYNAAVKAIATITIDTSDEDQALALITRLAYLINKR